jgi:hypothetical protein
VVFRKSPNEVYPEFFNIIQLWLGKFGRKGGRIKNNIKALILKQEAPQQHRPVAFPARCCGSGLWREDRDSRFEEDE